MLDRTIVCVFDHFPLIQFWEQVHFHKQSEARKCAKKKRVELGPTTACGPRLRLGGWCLVFGGEKYGVSRHTLCCAKDNPGDLSASIPGLAGVLLSQGRSEQFTNPRIHNSDTYVRGTIYQQSSAYIMLIYHADPRILDC